MNTATITIKNLTIASGSIEVNGGASAFVKSVAKGTGRLIDCANYATIISTGTNMGVGGLVAITGYAPVTFERCYNFGSVSSVAGGSAPGSIFGI